MSTSVETEHVLVVPTERFRKVGYFQGFSGEAERYLAELLREDWISYRPRAEMEEDPNFKQLIPYVLFRFSQDDGSCQLFQYMRGKGQGEKRLHAKRSIGIGGHISTEDLTHTTHATYQEGMQRELAEEVQIATQYESRCVGLINDDETEVGRVHLGVVHLLDVTTPDVRSNETDILDAGFRNVDALWNEVDALESWSRICLEALFPKTTD